MSTKTFVWGGLFIGSTIGGFIPTAFGADLFSLWPMLASSLGGIVGIWIGYQLGKNLSM